MLKKIYVSAVALFCSVLSHAAVEVGDAAPDFALSGSDGAVHKLADLRGQYVVLAFFPKAYTSG